MPIFADARTDFEHVDARRGTQAVILRVPEQSSSERIIALLIFSVSLAYLCLFRSYANLDCDEGIVLQGAQRILDGQVLYRDFFSFYTPGSYYLFALLFKLFGSSMLVAFTLRGHLLGSDIFDCTARVRALEFCPCSLSSYTLRSTQPLRGASQLG